MEDLLSILENLECWQLIDIEVIFAQVLAVVEVNCAVVGVVNTVLLHHSIERNLHRLAKSAPLGSHHHYNVLVSFQALIDVLLALDIDQHLLDFRLL